MKTLYVFAHTDDFFLWSFGSSMREKDRKNREILNIVLTKSLLRDIRNLELCKSFGINSENVCFKDLEEVVLSFNPDKVVTHWAFDSNIEHRKVYDKVSSVVLKQRIENKKGDLYSTSTYNSLGLDNKEFSPNRLVDISTYWKLKRQAILKLEDEPNKMWLDMIRKQNEFYGSRIKAKYAEAFRKVNINGVFDTSDSL
jgi:LmbE family N-acetylglucosaminyl deacetylase